MLRRPRMIPPLYRFIIEIVFLKEFEQLPIPTLFQHLQMTITQTVHPQRSYKRNLDSKAPMNPRAIKTQENAIVY